MWLTQVVLGVSIAVTTVLLLAHLRTAALRQSGHELRTLSLILSDQADRAFQAVDILPRGLFANIANHSVRTPDDLRHFASGFEIHENLTNESAMLPQLDAMGVVDADGRLITITRIWPPPKGSVADRAYFQELKANRDTDFAMSPPLLSRDGHVWALVLAHSIRGPNQTFLGLTFAGVQLGYFEKRYQRVADRADFSIALIRQDGLLLAHFPHLEKQMGGHYPEGDVVAGLLAHGGTDGDETPSPCDIDGKARLVSVHALASYPFAVSVSASLATAMAPWRKQAAYLSGAAALLEMVLILVGVLMSRQLRDQGILAEARAARAEAEAVVQVAHERERADRVLRVQHARFGAALDNMTQALWMYDSAGNLLFTNRRAAEMIGLDPGDITSGMTVAALGALFATKSNLQPADIDMMMESLSRLQTAGEPAALVRELTDGRGIAVNFVPIGDEGCLLTLEDITERRLIEARIQHMAHHDSLTGLPNRVLFHDRLSQAVARSHRGESSALMFLDLDHFKAVNDTLGHPVGDALLREVTRRLTKEVREIDTVARLGGDEFAVVQAKLNKPDGTATLAQRIIDVVSAPYMLDGQEVTIGTSIGIACAPEDGTDPDQLLKNADMALYQAKAAGRGVFRHFEAEMDIRMRARRKLETDLRKALADGELRVFYQPLVNLKTLRVCGFEALVRWFHPTRGLIPPTEFVAVAEEIGLIMELGDWVLRQACRDAVTWPGRLKVAVNLSPIQLGRSLVVADISDALHESGLSPDRLELEITETAMLEDTGAVLVTLHQIRDLGVRIAMDDFGTGYSSLSYLLRFPFNKVKIDRSFIEGVGQGGDSDVIVAAVINLCIALGMTITAEGVATVQQLTYIARRHCTEAQGYLFSKPRPAADVPDMIRHSEQQSSAALEATLAGT